MSQTDEEVILKSARLLYKNGYTHEAKSDLERLNTPQPKAILTKIGGVAKTKRHKGFTPIGLDLVAGYLAVIILAFALGWILAPKTQEARLLGAINEEIQAEDEPMATQTQIIINATYTVIMNSNEMALTQISASQPAAVETVTATAHEE